MMGAELKLTFLPVWLNVRKIRHEVGNLLESCSPDLRSSAMMTASELVENAIKYGGGVPASENVSFHLEASDEGIRIEVVNGSTNKQGVSELERLIREIMTIEDKQALYISRLSELVAHPGESGKLGIYRIGFEGGFDLQLDYTDQVVTVTATRKSDG
jgi:hypothetical protein